MLSRDHPRYRKGDNPPSPKLTDDLKTIQIFRPSIRRIIPQSADTRFSLRAEDLYQADPGKRVESGPAQFGNK